MFVCLRRPQVCTEDGLESHPHGGSRTSLPTRAVLRLEQGREAPLFSPRQSLIPFSPVCPGQPILVPSPSGNTAAHEPDQLLFPSKGEASADAIYSSSNGLATVGGNQEKSEHILRVGRFAFLQYVLNGGGVGQALGRLVP